MDPDRIAAEIYDQTVPDWPGEMDFYDDLARPARSILEVACGTGRIGLRLASAERSVDGFDISPQMIEIARRKGRGMPNVSWSVADMKCFDLGRTFDLVIIPGHSFQFMLTIADQLSCLESIRRHLPPGGLFVMHIDNQDLTWLGKLPSQVEGEFDAPAVVETSDGRAFHIAKRWSYEPATQTAAVITRYDEHNAAAEVIESAVRGPVRLHCFFRFEVEHLLQRAGFELQRLYGDFSQAPLSSSSSEMIWVAGRGR